MRLKIGTFWGIPVYLHWTFALIFLYAAWEGFTGGSTDPVRATAWMSGLFAAMFTCVLLHEYGHALMARRFGVKTQDIILTPIGGIARLEAMPRKPEQEFWVAIAGPAVNVMIVLLLFFPVASMLETDGRTLFQAIGDGLKAAFFSVENSGSEDSGTGGDGIGFQHSWPFFWLMLLFINCSLIVFNMIPAFPMDGGRVLRSLLAMRTTHLRATRVAAVIGQVFAAGFVALGLWKGSFTMPLIGLFVFNAARSEYGMVKLDDLLGRFSAGDLMRREFTELLSNDWMATAIEKWKAGSEKNFLVTDLDGNLVGSLGEAAIARAAKEGKTAAPVLDFCSPDHFSVGAEEPLRMVFALIKYHGFPIVGVHVDGVGAGVVDAPMLDAFLKKGKL